MMGRVGGALLVIVSQPLPQSEGGGGFLCEGCAVISESPDNLPGPGHFCCPPCCQAQQNPETEYDLVLVITKKLTFNRLHEQSHMLKMCPYIMTIRVLR